MDDFSPCCLKRIGELDREGLESTKEANENGLSCEIHMSGVCRACGTWLEFNHVYRMYQGELDLGTVSVEYPDRDSLVKPD